MIRINLFQFVPFKLSFCKEKINEKIRKNKNQQFFGVFDLKFEFTFNQFLGHL